MKVIYDLFNKFKFFEIEFWENNNDHENEFLAWLLS